MADAGRAAAPVIASVPFTVRASTSADRPHVLALVPRLRAFGPPPLRSPEALDAGELRTLNRFFDEHPDGTALWVAEDARGTIVGAAYAERAIDYFTQEPHAHLGILAVAAEAEGRGVGRALMETMEQSAADQGYRFVTLNVFAGNDRAAAIYARAGYRPDATKLVKELRPTPRN